MENEKNFTNEEQKEEGQTFSLENEQDIKELDKEMASENFFSLEEGVTYKIRLTSPKVRKIEKEFDDRVVTKYGINVKARGSDGSEFEGEWEVGKSILSPIMKNYEPNATFAVSRQGTGKKTRYSVTKDF